MKKKEKGKGLWAEFKAFISRGSVLDMAVGVVIGGAFSAIVTAVVNILLSLATWAVPGGLAGLVTVLPALTDGQKGLDGVGQSFAKSDYNAIAKLIGEAAGADDPLLYGSNIINSNYTAYGAKFYYNGSAIINWGAVINAVICFLIIAIVLFIVVKIAAVIRAKKAELDAKLLEEHYKKHPEDRPAPVEPGAPVPTELDVLSEIRDLLKAKEAK